MNMLSSHVLILTPPKPNGLVLKIFSSVFLKFQDYRAKNHQCALIHFTVEQYALIGAIASIFD